jgi:hypothetical protein
VRWTRSSILGAHEHAVRSRCRGRGRALEPLHKPEVVQQVGARTGFAKGEIIRSDFDRVFATAYGAVAGKKLKTQYRMLPPIGQLVSDTFYRRNDKEINRCNLLPVIAKETLPALQWPALPRQHVDRDRRLRDIDAQF